MKKLARVLFSLCLLAAISISVYGAFCKDKNGTKFCGHTCQTSGTSCSCEGDCSEAEIEAVAS